MKYNYKIVSILSNGNDATVYKIKIGSLYYALRRQKILDSEAHDFINTHLYNNIIFNEFINKINKNHFAILYKYKISSNCKFKQKLTDFTLNNSEKLKDYYLKEKSKYCLDMIIDLKDGIICDILYRLSRKQLYSMIIQCVYALNIMHKNGYYHNDLHNKNIMYKKTKIKTLKILNLNVPTYGYLWSIIDYNSVATSSQISNNKIIIMCINNYAYRDLMLFLCWTIFDSCSKLDKLIYKIIINDSKIKDDPFFELFKVKPLSYEDTKNYIKYINNVPSLIKYFYNQIKFLSIQSAN